MTIAWKVLAEKILKNLRLFPLIVFAKIFCKKYPRFSVWNFRMYIFVPPTVFQKINPIWSDSSWEEIIKELADVSPNCPWNNFLFWSHSQTIYLIRYAKAVFVDVFKLINNSPFINKIWSLYSTAWWRSSYDLF